MSIRHILTSAGAICSITWFCLVGSIQAEPLRFDGPADLTQLADSAPTFTLPDTGNETEEVQGSDRIYEQLVMLLSGYEYFPSADDLLQVTSEPVPYLLSIIYEESTLVVHRHRAIGALALFPDVRSRTHLNHLLDSPATPELTRHHVINALAMGFGEAALEGLAPFLGAEDLQFRLTAVQAIGSMEGAEAVTLLEETLRVEQHTLVRERIQGHLVTGTGSQLR